MSDRVAVFNLGRVEQVGSPAEIYEHPNTAFVAGFVGTSNLISGELANTITGSPQAFSIRPEKIRMCSPGDPVGAEACAAEGKIIDVAYLGVMTRYLVELADGSTLTVVEQNLATTSMDVMAAQGRPVQLIWQREHNRPIGEG